MPSTRRARPARTQSDGAIRRRLPAAVLAVLLLCAGPGAWAASGPAPHGADSQDFRQERAEWVFTKALRVIDERYLRPVDFTPLVVAGLQALQLRDPELRIEQRDDVLYLHVDGSIVGTYSLPENTGSDDWAMLIAELAATAHGRSARLGAASEEEVLELIFDALLSRLDGFSRYASPSEARDHQAMRRGFGGIGIRFTMNPRGILVRSVLPDTPAAAAGIAAGDTIIAVDRRSVRGLRAGDVTRLLRGPIDSTVDLTLVRANGEGPFPTPLTRAQVIPPTVTVSARNGVLTARVGGFNRNTVPSLRRAIVEHQLVSPDGLRGLILDLRDNRGGLLRQAVDMVDLFVPAGEIIGTRGRHASSSRTYRATGAAIATGVPMVVLVNGNSASSAEIVAASLQDHHRALLVGTNSYGKGLVQTVVQLPNDGEMVLTWSRLMTPSGYPLQGLGVLPTICTSGERDGLDWQFERLRAGDELAITRVMARWRLVRDAAEEERERLRAACRGGGDPDLELVAARALLAEPALLDRAIRMERGAPGPAAGEVLSLTEGGVAPPDYN